jgi:hypothetical protein
MEKVRSCISIKIVLSIEEMCRECRFFRNFKTDSSFMFYDSGGQLTTGLSYVYGRAIGTVKPINAYTLYISVVSVYNKMTQLNDDVNSYYTVRKNTNNILFCLSKAFLLTTTNKPTNKQTNKQKKKLKTRTRKLHIF